MSKVKMIIHIDCGVEMDFIGSLPNFPDPPLRHPYAPKNRGLYYCELCNAVVMYSEGGMYDVTFNHINPGITRSYLELKQKETGFVGVGVQSNTSASARGKAV